jgi:RNA polymerase sigma-70 factor (ECF subfamily)
MSSLMTDNEIMLKVKNGDLDKMALLFNRHQRALYGFLYLMTRHRESSEDMVQNVFYRILKYRHTYTGKGEFTAWMYHLAMNVFKDNYKKYKRNLLESDISEFTEIVGDSDLTDEKLQKVQEVKNLYEAINNLSVADREILVLSQFQKLKYQEIALILNTTEGAVKVRVHRAFNQLKALYFKTESNGM